MARLQAELLRGAAPLLVAARLARRLAAQRRQAAIEQPDDAAALQAQRRPAAVAAGVQRLKMYPFLGAEPAAAAAAAEAVDAAAMGAGGEEVAVTENEQAAAKAAVDAAVAGERYREAAWEALRALGAPGQPDSQAVPDSNRLAWLQRVFVDQLVDARGEVHAHVLLALGQ